MSDPVYPVNSCFAQISEWRTKTTLLQFFPEFVRNSLSFPCSEKSLSNPGILGLQPSLYWFSRVITHKNSTQFGSDTEPRQNSVFAWRSQLQQTEFMQQRSCIQFSSHFVLIWLLYKFVFSFLRQLTSWHCSHLLLNAVRLCRCWSIFPTCWAHSSKPATVARSSLLHRTCCILCKQWQKTHSPNSWLSKLRSAFFVTVRAGTVYRKIWRLVNNFFCSHNKVPCSEIPIVLSNLLYHYFFSLNYGTFKFCD